VVHLGGTGRTIELAGSTIECHCHVCAFFHSRDDEYNILIPFMMDGFAASDRSVQIVEKTHVAERLRRIAEGGIDLKKAEETKQLEIRGWEDAYLSEGRFDQHAMLRLIEELLISGQELQFPTTRLWANMEWALEDLPGVHDIVEYESRLNLVLPSYNSVVVCTYDLAKFGASVVMDVLRTHPYAIVGGVLQQNPFYAPPGEFLLELNRRPSA